MKKCWSEMYQFELTDPVGKETLNYLADGLDIPIWHSNELTVTLYPIQHS